MISLDKGRLKHESWGFRVHREKSLWYSLGGQEPVSLYALLCRCVKQFFDIKVDEELWRCFGEIVRFGKAAVSCRLALQEDDCQDCPANNWKLLIGHEMCTHARKHS
jgi:hypothetical protein